MKKVLFGILILGALSACSSSEEKVDIPTQVQTLTEKVNAQTEEYNTLKEETEELKMQVEELNKTMNESK